MTITVGCPQVKDGTLKAEKVAVKAVKGIAAHIESKDKKQGI